MVESKLRLLSKHLHLSVLMVESKLDVKIVHGMPWKISYKFTNSSLGGTFTVQLELEPKRGKRLRLDEEVNAGVSEVYRFHLGQVDMEPRTGWEFNYRKFVEFGSVYSDVDPTPAAVYVNACEMAGNFEVAINSVIVSAVRIVCNLEVIEEQDSDEQDAEGQDSDELDSDEHNSDDDSNDD